MTEQEFKHNMAGAKTFSELGDRQSFFSGYMRGLRRLHHGESFGTEEEHEQFMNLVDEFDESRADLSKGYRCGFEGVGIAELLESHK